VKLLLPQHIAEELQQALGKAGLREIGGILMGEHVSLDTFRIHRITIQYSGGTFSAFLRVVEGILGPLRDFFSATNHDYVRFNYLGEWHSHHSFALLPSARDCQSMNDILADPKVGARFVVLLLVKLNAQGTLLHGASAFQPDGHSEFGEVVVEL
jgi:hypothetical protein